MNYWDLVVVYIGLNFVYGLLMMFFQLIRMAWLCSLGKPCCEDASSGGLSFLSPFVMGLIERFAVIILVSNSVQGAAGFFGAWVVVKAAGGWGKLVGIKQEPWRGSERKRMEMKKKERINREAYMTALMMSALSLTGGVIIGLWLKGIDDDALPQLLKRLPPCGFLVSLQEHQN